MYYPPTSQVVGKWVILTLIGLGLVLGLVLIGSELVNPLDSLSKFQDAQVERQRIQQQGEIDLRQYEALQEANTQAEIARKQEEVRHQRQLHEEEAQHQKEIHEQELQQSEEETRYRQQLHNQELQSAQARAALGLQLLRDVGYGGIVVGALVLFVLSIGLGARVAKRRSKAASSANVWTPERKRRGIEAARRREREQRRQALHEQKLHQLVTQFQDQLQELAVSIGSNGHEDSDETLLESLLSASDCDETNPLCTQISSDAKNATAN
jgi:hypothetical protein